MRRDPGPLRLHGARPRLLRCEVAVGDIHPIGARGLDGPAKCKVPTLRVVAEVDLVGRPLPDAVDSTVTA